MELLNQGKPLRDLLDAGAEGILERNEKMEEHRRALDTAKLRSTEGKEWQRYDKNELIKLLVTGTIQKFNDLRIKLNISAPDLSHADLYGAKLFRANLSNANLSGADLSGARLSHAYLSEADLSEADLSSSIIIGCKGYQDNLICENARFKRAIIDDVNFTKYLSNKNEKIYHRL